MSYAITVHVTDGEATVHTSGDVPDGVYHVTGHDLNSPLTRSITVQHTDHEGGLLVSAGATHTKHERHAE